VQLRHTYAARFLRTESIALAGGVIPELSRRGVVVDCRPQKLKLGSYEEFLGLIQNPNPYFFLIPNQQRNHMQLQHDVDSQAAGVFKV